jgi:hypothetical protein
MMKILTQKMLGAQGWRTPCQHFVISSEVRNPLFKVWKAGLPSIPQHVLLAFARRNDNR